METIGAVVREIGLSAGTIRYRESGTGRPIVFVHGLAVNGALWRKVAPSLAREYRCIVPDWPLGSHELPMAADADLSPPGLARLIDEFLAALGLEDVTLVANDTGGAICQILVTSAPGRVGRLVLTSCDAFDNFLPAAFRPLQWGARIPGFLWVVAALLQLPRIDRLPITFGWLSKRPIEPGVVARYVGPSWRGAEVRRDLGRILRAISSSYTMEAARRLGEYRRPVLIAWASEDRFFPVEHAQRLAKAFPDSRLALIADSYTFLPEDQPEALAGCIREFLVETAGARGANRAGVS